MLNDQERKTHFPLRDMPFQMKTHNYKSGHDPISKRNP